MAKAVKSHPPSPNPKHETASSRNSIIKWYIIWGLDRLEKVDAYKKWYKNISTDLLEELKIKEIALFCESMNAETPLEYSFWEQVGHYEQFLSEKNKKKTYARYTRRAVENLGVKTFLKNLIGKPETLGFKSLEEFDSLDISYEQVVLKHADEFDVGIIEIVNKRLLPQD